MVEGMAYISSPNWFPQPRLVLAGLASDYSLRMNTYDFPLPGNSPVENPITLRSTGLNHNIFSRGLGSRDSGLSSRQKVAAMQYFDGLLYLLFDNAMLIRVFDSDGNMIQETKLPVAVEGFEKQWEGMELAPKERWRSNLTSCIGQPSSSVVIETGKCARRSWLEATTLCDLIGTIFRG